MSKSRKGSGKVKTNELRRDELLILEAQRTILEQRIEQLVEKGGGVVEAEEISNSGGRKAKRELTGVALPDRSKGNKRPKHETTVKLEDMFNTCRKLMTQLKRARNAEPFLVPVDPVALNCPDYFSIIKHPMDFKTISMKLRATNLQYNSPLEFRDDVRIVFRNCSLYNPEGNQIRVMGDRLSETFENLWQHTNIEKLYQERKRILSKQKNEIDVLSDEGEQRQRTKKSKVQTVEYSVKRLTEVQKKLTEFTSSALNNLSEERIDVARPMGFWQKRQLSQELDNLPVDVLKKLQPILQEIGDKDEVEFDSLEDHVLWKIKDLVNTHHCHKHYDQQQQQQQQQLPPDSTMAKEAAEEATTLKSNKTEEEEEEEEEGSKSLENNMKTEENVETKEQEGNQQHQPSGDLKDAMENEEVVDEKRERKEHELEEDGEKEDANHGYSGCCVQEMVKEPQSNGNDDRMDKSAPHALN